MLNFGDLYQRYAQDVFRFALYLSGNRTLAEDIVSETFMRALLAKEEIRVGTVKAYLLMIARNLYLTGIRNARGQDDLDQGMLDPVPGPDVLFSSQQELQTVLAELQRLPEVDRAAVLMRAQDGMSYEEIAVALKLSVPAVKVKVHRARVKLRQFREGKE